MYLARLAPLATLPLLFASLGCPESPAPVRVDAGQRLVCGEGTFEKEGACVALPAEDAGAPDLVACGEGTRLSADGLRCEAVPVCAPGTVPLAEGSGCAPACADPFVLEGSSCVCPPGLVRSAGGGDCEIDAALCGEGTVFVDGVCVPTGAPALDEDDQNPDEAPIFFPLPGVNDKPAEFGGIVGPYEREGGADLDVFRFQAQGGERLRIQVVSFGAQAASFILVGIDEQNEAFLRMAIPLTQRRAVRQVVLPVAGRYGIIVSERSNLFALLGTSDIPAGGADHSYGLYVDTLPPQPATLLAPDASLQEGEHDHIAAYRIDPAATAPGDLLRATLLPSDLDPDGDTYQLLWAVDGAGVYREFLPGAGSPGVDALVSQQGGGVVLHVDYFWRLGLNPAYPYALRVGAPEVHPGPEPGAGALGDSTGGESPVFYQVDLAAEHVYRARLQLPSSTTLAEASLLLVGADLQTRAQSVPVVVDGVAYEELRYFAGPDDAGRHYLVVDSQPLADGALPPNTQVRLTLDEAPVIRGPTLSLAAGAEPALALDAPADPDDDAWGGPWVLGLVQQVGRLEVAASAGVDFETFEARSFSPLPQANDALLLGQCSADESATLLTEDIDFVVNLGMAGDQWRSGTLACGVGNGGDFALRIAPQPAGVTVQVDAESAADVSLGFQRTCAEACIAQSDLGFTGDPESTTYTFDGTESGPLLLVVDSWFGAIEDVRVRVRFVGRPGGDVAATRRDYDVLGGTQVLVRAFGGAGAGGFTLRTALASSPYPWEQEPNDGPDVATLLPAGEGDDAARHGVLRAGDADWWRIGVAEGGLLRIDVGEGAIPTAADVALELVSEASGEILSSAEFLMGSGAEGGTLAAYVEPGIYFAAVTLAPVREVSFLGMSFQVGGQAGTYSLGWSLEAGLAPSSTCSAPIVLPGAGVYAGSTSTNLSHWQPADSACFGSAPDDYASPDDIYAVRVEPGATLRARVTRQGTFDPALALLEGSCAGSCLVGSDDFFSAATVESVSFVNEAAEARELFLVVDGFGGTSGDYVLEIDLIGSFCVPGAQRCGADGAAEVCNDEGTAFDARSCPAGCLFDPFEQSASCKPYCGPGTDLPAARCTDTLLQRCDDDGTRYRDSACAVACLEQPAAGPDEVGDAFCTYGVCTPGSGTCEVVGGIARATLCNEDASASVSVSCASGCDAAGEACALLVPDALAIEPTLGACTPGTTPGTPVSESGRWVLATTGAEGDDFDATTNSCGSDVEGADLTFLLGPKSAGTTVRVRVQGDDIDPMLGFQRACSAVEEECIGLVDEGFVNGVAEESTYTFDGTETDGVLVVIDSWNVDFSGDLEVDVAFSDDTFLPLAPAFCAPGAMVCADGIESVCDDEGMSEQRTYCREGCDSAGVACAELQLTLGESCADAAELPAAFFDYPGEGLELPFSLVGFASDAEGYCAYDGLSGGSDGVFTFVAPAAGGVGLEFLGSDFVIYAQEGGCDAPVLTCVDDYALGEVLSLALRAGQRYTVYVDLLTADDTDQGLTMRWYWEPE